MRYAIIANPASGKMKVDQKRSVLARAAEILDSDINGLDTETPEEFTQCAQELATRCDLLVVAGGDGSLSDIINSIDTAKIPIGFLPLGTGNAMGHALKYKGAYLTLPCALERGRYINTILSTVKKKTCIYVSSRDRRNNHPAP